MEKNIPIVESPSCKPRSDDTDDWMDDYLELESSTNNDFDLILENNKVYIIIVKYSDGIVRTLKTIK